MGRYTTETAQAKTAPGPGIRALFTYGPKLLRQDPVDVAVNLREQYGHVVRIPPVYPGLDRPAYLVTHPNAVQYILQSHPDAFDELDIPGSEDFTAAVEGSVLGPPEDNDPEWEMERLWQLSSEFNEHAAVEHVPALAQETATILTEYTADRAEESAVSSTPQHSKLQRVLDDRPNPAAVMTDTQGVIRLLPLMNRLSIRLIAISVFGSDIRAHEAAVIRAVAQLRRVFKRRAFGVVSRRLPDWISSSLLTLLRMLGEGQADDQLRDSLQTLQNVADGIVARRERTPRIFDDAVTTLLTQPNPVTGETLTSDSACHAIFGLLTAGYATVSTALTWAVYLAATHPEIQERIHEEVRTSSLFAPLEDTGHTDSGWVPDHAKLFDELAVTHRVWQETLRLYPTLPIFGQTARDGVELNGYAIETGAPVLVSPYVTHRDPVFWDHPTEFNPDRFLPKRCRDRPEFAYYPFSAGPHGCLGRKIATTEAVVALATLFREYRVELADVDTSTVGVDSAINLQPNRDLYVRLVRRPG